MVFLTRIMFKKPIHFHDSVRLFVRGGPGGGGMPKIGGQGGRGGHVYVVAEERKTLKQIIKRLQSGHKLAAGPGTSSRTVQMFGQPGGDLVIGVPPGVVIRNENGRVLGEVLELGDKVLAARGGQGGNPENNFFGQAGEKHHIILDLKMIADIGLVGFPNAGKSSLIRAVTRLKPKIQSYPFTTIVPQIGTLVYPDGRQISMADLPGLIEGAHINQGMGHKFLKHVKRTKLLLFVVDVNGFRLSPKQPLRTAMENVLLLNRELELYDETLLDKPTLLAVNKIDVDGADTLADELVDKIQNAHKYLKDYDKLFHPERMIKFDEIIKISAKESQNTDYLAERLRHHLDINADIKNNEALSPEEFTSELESKLHVHNGQLLT